MTDTSTAAIEMVASDLGCAVVVERFARQAIDSGQRIAVAGDPVALGHAHFLVKSRARAGLQPHVETFTSWLREQF